MHRPTWAEVDLSAIRDNIKAIREKVGPKVKLMPAVKANAYGHGAAPVGRACLEAGAHVLSVCCVEEAQELHEAGIGSPILILGCSTPDSAGEIVQNGFISTLCDLDIAHALSKAAHSRGKKAVAHIKLDTGMGRIGVSVGEAVEFARAVSALPGIVLEGLFTHLADTGNPDKSFTLAQLALIGEVASELRHGGIRVPIVHAANSAAVLEHPEAYFDAVRPGIIVYGVYPSADAPRSVPLREALTLKSRIVFLKDAEVGATISYGRTHTVKRKSKIATLPIGYADGYSRLLSNKGEACVRGSRVPVVGRVCMDQIMLDVTDVPGVSTGDEVILYGGGIDYLSVDAIADKIGTISYEVLCAISQRVPRIYVNV